MDPEEIDSYVPHMRLSHLRFLLSSDEIEVDKKALSAELFEGIKKHDMAPFYSEVCEHLKWTVDTALEQTMKDKNEKESDTLDEKIRDAEENLGESEVREASLAKAEFLVRIGESMEKVLESCAFVEKKTVALGQKLDLVLMTIRTGFFHGDYKIVEKQIEKAKNLLEKGGDWERRNRLKVYEALYLMAVRKTKEAALLFLESIATFTAYELLGYNEFIRYTVLASVCSLDRPTLRDKVLEAPEILAVILEIPNLEEFLNSLYQCDYGLFFRTLGSIFDQIKADRYMQPHFRYFCREFRAVAYQQFLESYKSVTLERMACSFGVSATFLDKELSRYIAGGRLNCKIDKVSGVVVTTRPDNRNGQYQSIIKNGDILLNRIQKLSRVIDM